jgi:beta-fructofuranosidase
MTLMLKDKWIWDFWHVRSGADYHFFYLQSPRSIGNPELRHWNVSIGHAVTQDLQHWEVFPDALGPSLSPSWDDYTTWTGSVLQHNGLWHLFYTGSSRAEKGLIQRIGLATSKDLIHWEKHPANPLIEADSRWYEKLNLQTWLDEAWRDPWVFWHEGAFHALITGRVNHGPVDERGVIAHARSTDLITWDVLPPLLGSNYFGQMEVPQIIELEGGAYLLFSCAAQELSTKGVKKYGKVTGSYVLPMKDFLTPLDRVEPYPLFVDETASLYSGKIIQSSGGEWLFMAFENMNESGCFVGELSVPMCVEISPKDKFLAIKVKNKKRTCH